MSSNYRLAVLCDAVEVGGAEHVLAHLLAGLPDGVRILVLARDPDVLGVLQRSRPEATGVVLPMRLSSARRALRRHGTAVVHANLTALTACRPLVLAALSLRLPVVLVDHLPMPGLTWRGRAVQRLLTRRSAARVAVGRQVARLVERHAGLPPGVVGAIPNGVPRGRQAAVRDPRGPCVFGVLGRLEPQKGVDLLLTALAAVPGARLEVMGSGSCSGALERQAAGLGLTARVRFTAGSPDTAAFWDGIDVLVVPSRAEAMPLVVLEALRYGRPVVATDVGSVAELVDDQVGALVPAGDAAALATALGRLAGDPGLRSAMREEAGRRAGAAWSSAEMAAAYDALYRSVLPASRPGGRAGPAAG